jgi:hypothetical protein
VGYEAKYGVISGIYESACLKRSQIGGERTRIRVPAFWTRIDRFVDDCDEIVIDAGFTEDAMAVAYVCWRYPLDCTEFPEHRTDREDVSALIHVFASFLLWSHVSRCAEDATCASELIVVINTRTTEIRRGAFARAKILRETPINYDGFTEITNDDVSWFEIPMNDVAAMGVRDGVGDSDDMVKKTNTLFYCSSFGDQFTKWSPCD